MPIYSKAIEISELSKRYHGASKDSLSRLSLSVGSGEVYGFLGPNGAGKSTTIRLLLNFIQPTRGKATILGLDIVNDSVKLKSQLGYLTGEVSLYNKMTGRQFLGFISQLTPVKHPKYLKQLINTYQAQLDQPIRELSKGNRQKLGLIQAFMHEPEVLILDEPTSGLDPLMQAVFFDYVKEVKRNGAAVFLSSHDLSEVQKICDRVGFIRDGKLVTEQSIVDLAKLSSHVFEIAFAGAVPLDDLRSLSSLKLRHIEKGLAIVEVKGSLAPFFRLLSRHDVLTIDRQELSLEQEFMHLYEGGRQ